MQYCFLKMEKLSVWWLFMKYEGLCCPLVDNANIATNGLWEWLDRSLYYETLPHVLYKQQK